MRKFFYSAWCRAPSGLIGTSYANKNSFELLRDSKAISYSWGMKLSAYLREKGFSHAAFGKTIGVSQPIMSGWVNGGSVPEKRAVQIERATEGAVTRRDLRPDDWHEIWPELAISEEKQPLPSAERSSAATESIAFQGGANA